MRVVDPLPRSQPAGRIALVLAALATVAALVPIVIGLSITSPAAQGSTSNLRALPPSSIAGAGTGVSVVSSLPRGPGALVAFVQQPTMLRRTPGGRALHRLGTHTEFNSPEVLWVVAPRGRWLGVVSPLVGNARLGWIPRSAVTLQRVDWQINVSLSARSVTVLHAGTVIKRYTVAIGRPEAPTPTGRFAVTDRLATNNPTGPYGCCIIALSARAPHAIQDWSGGDRIAIHSTPETATIGEPVSHGCLRLTLAEGRWLMNHIPLGTPTLISA